MGAQRAQPGAVERLAHRRVESGVHRAGVHRARIRRLRVVRGRHLAGARGARPVRAGGGRYAGRGTSCDRRPAGRADWRGAALHQLRLRHVESGGAPRVADDRAHRRLLGRVCARRAAARRWRARGALRRARVVHESRGRVFHRGSGAGRALDALAIAAARGGVRRHARDSRGRCASGAVDDRRYRRLGTRHRTGVRAPPLERIPVLQLADDGHAQAVRTRFAISWIARHGCRSSTAFLPARG